MKTRFAWALVLLFAAVLAGAQRPVSAPRPDGTVAPLMVYGNVRLADGCAPLAVISHGAGGSDRGYVYLAKGLADAGYLAIVMGHRDSGLEALRDDMRGAGIRGGLMRLVGDPKAYASRMQDIHAALNWASAQCHAPYKVLLGHSMGAETVMLEAGAKNRIGVTYPPAGQDRFDAYVALSSEGPGMVFPQDAWVGIRKPMFVLTGTRDQALEGGPANRKIPFAGLPADGSRGCHWLGVVDGATHMNFAGNGPGALEVDALITPLMVNFLQQSQAGHCSLPAAQAGIVMQAK